MSASTAPVRQGRESAAPELPPGEVLSTISLVMDGRHRVFQMSPGDASVLAAAERAGARAAFFLPRRHMRHVPHQGQIGRVAMAHNIALEPWEVDAGFILCCQARPLTDTLELTYDEK